MKKFTNVSPYRVYWPMCSHMPPLRHVRYQDGYNLAGSKVVAWIMEKCGVDITKAEAIRRSAALQGFLVCDPETKCWKGDPTPPELRKAKQAAEQKAAEGEAAEAPHEESWLERMGREMREAEVKA